MVILGPNNTLNGRIHSLVPSDFLLGSGLTRFWKLRSNRLRLEDNHICTRPSLWARLRRGLATLVRVHTKSFLEEHRTKKQGGS